MERNSNNKNSNNNNSKSAPAIWYTTPAVFIDYKPLNSCCKRAVLLPTIGAFAHYTITKTLYGNIREPTTRLLYSNNLILETCQEGRGRIPIHYSSATHDEHEAMTGHHRYLVAIRSADKCLPYGRIRSSRKL